MTVVVELDEALSLARRYHEGQHDLAGEPYLGHILRVVARVDTPEEKLTAAMHDLLEDTPLTSQDLRDLGVPAEVVTAVEAVTRRDGEEYEAFCARSDRQGREARRPRRQRRRVATVKARRREGCDAASQVPRRPAGD